MTKIFTKALLTLFVGVMMITGLAILIPEAIVGIIGGYCAGVTSLVLIAELIDRFELR